MAFQSRFVRRDPATRLAAGARGPAVSAARAVPTGTLRARARRAGARPRGSNSTRADGCYPLRTPPNRPDRGPRAAPQAHGEVRHRRRRAAVRHDGSGREQERRAADPRLRRPHRRARSSSATCRGSATSRRCSRSCSAIGVEVSWRGPNEVALCAAKVGAVEIDRELAELIRASFLLAGPLLARFHRAVMPPPGGDVIGRRRLDPHLDAFRAMGAVADCGREIVLSAPRGLRPDRRVHGRALRDGDRERADGRRAHARHDRDRQRRLRAPRAGPRAHARQDGRRHPGHRLEPAHGQRRRAPARLRARRRAGPHRDRQLHGARRRDRRRAADQGHGPRRPAHDPARLRAARPALGAPTATT